MISSCESKKKKKKKIVPSAADFSNFQQANVFVMKC